MTRIKFKVTSNSPKATASAMKLKAVQMVEDKPTLLTAEQIGVKNIDLVALKISGAAESTARIQTADSILGLVGVGDGITTSEKARDLGGVVGRNFNDQKSLVVEIPFTHAEHVLAFIEGIAFVQYDYTKYKSKPKSVSQLTTVTIISQHRVSTAQLTRVTVLAEALDATRDLANAPGNDLYPSILAEAISAQSKIPNVKVEIWDEKKLQKERCNGILAVGSGSVRPPRLVKITYSPPNAKAHLALVGKGITFDTGGITLKPSTGILGMYYDMAGAATVGEATLAIARLELPVKVTTFMCIAENMPSGSATRPNDVITFRNGKTVEVTNTDAEGRLVMADGLILASELKPDLIVDLATLTGAARVALGNRYTGLMGDDESVEKLKHAAKDSGELVWHMPLPEELFDLIQSDTADLMNSRVGNPAGGMLVAGLFLREFVGPRSSKDKTKLNWAHLDFATAANNDLAPYGSTLKGATGAMLRTLVALAEQMGTKTKK